MPPGLILHCSLQRVVRDSGGSGLARFGQPSIRAYQGRAQEPVGAGGDSRGWGAIYERPCEPTRDEERLARLHPEPLALLKLDIDPAFEHVDERAVADVMCQPVGLVIPAVALIT
jgi:hypothetical protein